ncbi:hypothetical protein Tco_1351513 [Tanacetum coccineum]
MKAEQQPWTIHLQAKAKNFEFKFKATKYLPPTFYNFLHFSFFINISHLFIQVSSDNRRRSSLKCRVIDKIWNRPAKRKAFAANKDSRIKGFKWASCQGPLCATTVVIGNFALLIQSIYDKDAKGIVIHCSSILLYILWQLKIIMGTKANKLLLVSVLVMVGYPLWSYMTAQYHHGETTIASRYINKAWNWAAYKAFLHVIAQSQVWWAGSHIAQFYIMLTPDSQSAARCV